MCMLLDPRFEVTNLPPIASDKAKAYVEAFCPQYLECIQDNRRVFMCSDSPDYDVDPAGVLEDIARVVLFRCIVFLVKLKPKMNNTDRFKRQSTIVEVLQERAEIT